MNNNNDEDDATVKRMCVRWMMDKICALQYCNLWAAVTTVECERATLPFVLQKSEEFTDEVCSETLLAHICANARSATFVGDLVYVFYMLTQVEYPFACSVLFCEASQRRLAKQVTEVVDNADARLGLVTSFANRGLTFFRDFIERSEPEPQTPLPSAALVNVLDQSQLIDNNRATPAAVADNPYQLHPPQSATHGNNDHRHTATCQTLRAGDASVTNSTVDEKAIESFLAEETDEEKAEALCLRDVAAEAAEPVVTPTPPERIATRRGSNFRLSQLPGHAASVTTKAVSGSSSRQQRDASVAPPPLPRHATPSFVDAVSNRMKRALDCYLVNVNFAEGVTALLPTAACAAGVTVGVILDHLDRAQGNDLVAVLTHKGGGVLSLDRCARSPEDCGDWVLVWLPKSEVVTVTVHSPSHDATRQFRCASARTSFNDVFFWCGSAFAGVRGATAFLSCCGEVVAVQEGENVRPSMNTAEGTLDKRAGALHHTMHFVLHVKRLRKTPLPA